MLAIIAIGAILAFVVGDPLMRLMGRRSAKDENPVVVETKYGKLKERDLQAMRNSRELVEVFLQRVSAETIANQVRNGALDSRLADTVTLRWYETWRQQLMGRSSAAPEAAVVETLVLSKKAQQMGIVISDRAINDFIKQVSDDTLTSEALERIIANLQGGGRRVSAVRLFEAIRTEMLASKVAELFAQSLRDVPPAQRFDYYCRLNRRAKVELMPLAVSEFVAQVSDPNPADLQAFFDKYKDRYADPASPEPGFKEPKRATFQYFKADFAKFKDEYAPKVTDEEIADYYEKNKGAFLATELPAEPPAEKPAEQSPDETPKQGEAPKADEGKPEETTPEPRKDEPPKPDSPDKPQADKKPDATSSDDKTSHLQRSAPLRLVSAIADGAPAKSTVEDADDKTEPEATPAVEGPSLDSKTDAPADAQKPADAERAAENPSADTAEKNDDSESEKKSEPPKYEPLEKVKDQIRSSIAARKASERIGEIFDELTSEMRRYGDDIDAYNARKSGDTSSAPPKPFPFAELAKKYGIEAKELPQVSAEEAAAEDLGRLEQRIRDPRSPVGVRSEPFTSFAFSDNFPTYRAEVLQDNEGNGYLFWKTEETEAYVPTLDDVRERVVRAWKMIKARELARKRADEYAAQARKEAKPLKEAFANQPNLAVTQTDWFSWMTIGNVPLDPSGGRPRLSSVEGVDHVGQAFMADVFKLSPGEISVTSNEPHNTVYVVRLAEFEKPTDELRQEFASERRPMYMAVAMPDQRKIYEAWLKDVEKDASVHWLRQADIARRGRAVDVDSDMPDEDMEF